MGFLPNKHFTDILLYLVSFCVNLPQTGNADLILLNIYVKHVLIFFFIAIDKLRMCYPYK